VTDLARLSAAELLAGYAARTFSPPEVMESLARRIEDVEPRLSAFVTLTLDEAAAGAAAAEARWQAGTHRPLEGVPFAVKDLFDTAGVRTTYGSPMFAEHVPTSDAEAVRLANEAGAILVGKTSTHEFAWGITGYNAHFGTGRNPWNLSYVSGGSSAGSGAALAADEVPLALGSDTGGSIRVPAAFCGVVGLKPTYGRVSAAGVFPLAPSLDHVGPLARTPRDARLFLSVLAPAEPVPARADVRGLRIGICADLVPVEPDPAVRRALDDTIAILAGLGCESVEVDFDGAAGIRGIHAAVQQVEALRTHRDAGLWPQRRSEYGEDVGGRLAAAETVTFDDYVEAIAAREQLRARFDRLFDAVDLLVTPVSPASPVEWGLEDLEHLGERRLFRDLVLPLSTPQDVVGVPACSVRAGFDEHGVPVGVQLTGPRGSEAALLAAADAFFHATPELQGRRPEI
jgi:aspartyl-tRNA(Asn)/glutamyl-tRNA(Gln) amidotransferase subunit A